jgi:hypothetical protein
MELLSFGVIKSKGIRYRIDYLKSASSLLETSILNVAPESDLSGLNLFYDF